MIGSHCIKCWAKTHVNGSKLTDRAPATKPKAEDEPEADETDQNDHKPDAKLTDLLKDAAATNGDQRLTLDQVKLAVSRATSLRTHTVPATFSNVDRASQGAEFNRPFAARYRPNVLNTDCSVDTLLTFYQPLCGRMPQTQPGSSPDHLEALSNCSHDPASSPWTSTPKTMILPQQALLWKSISDMA